MKAELVSALETARGVLRRRDHPELTSALRSALRWGALVSILPGIYVRPEDAKTLLSRARAACLADPDAVITGRAAAALLWPEMPEPDIVTVATLRRPAPRPGYRWERRHVPVVLRRHVGDVRTTNGPLTLIDMAEEVPGALEWALREKRLSPEALGTVLALTRKRRGNVSRHRAVRQVSGNPWSHAERVAHAALRRARITGWCANESVYDRRGEERLGYGDLVFHRHRLIVEIDGKSHRTPEGRAHDSARDLAMARAGWEVVRVPASLVLRDPDAFARLVREVLRTRARRVHPARSPK